MAVLSKAAEWLQGAPVLETTCHETFHTWQRDCNVAYIDAIPNAFKFSFRTYAAFYIATRLFAAKGNVKKVDWKKWLRETVQSSVFLTSNLVGYLFFLCRIRHLLGFFWIPSLGYWNGILASFCSILIEKKSRRPALALYLTNLASETMYRQACNHGYMKMIPGGTFIPFSIGLAIMKYLSVRGTLSPSLKGPLSSVLQEKPENALKQVEVYAERAKRKLPSEFGALLERLKTECSRTAECDHDHSCAYNLTKTVGHNFSVGLALSCALTLLRNLTNVFTKPTAVVRALLSASNMKIPLFFGLLPLLYHSSRCSMNRLPRPVRPPPPVRDVSAAAVSGAALIAFPNISIAMFTMWKSFEALYSDLVDRGYARWVPHGDVLLYSLSTGYVLGCALYEPHAVRPAYIKFLEQLTGNRIKVFNRTWFDYLGAHSSKYYGVPTDITLL